MGIRPFLFRNMICIPANSTTSWAGSTLFLSGTLFRTIDRSMSVLLGLYRTIPLQIRLLARFHINQLTIILVISYLH